mgnify:CR=1 FL=1
MKQAAFARPGMFDGGERLALGLVARLRGALDDYRTYRRTMTELGALTARQREDAGFAGLDLKAIARDATFRN